MRPEAATVLNDMNVKKVLSRYIDIVEGKRTAKFLLAKKMKGNFDKNATLDDLLKMHSENLASYHNFEKQIDEGNIKLDELSNGFSFLDLKEVIAEKIMCNCHFCMRKCGVNRFSGEKGYCGCGIEFAVSSCFPHLGEEPELVPSGTIFTCGCSISCIHCQNWSISQWKESHKFINSSLMVDLIKSLKDQGCRNINMVGGDPTPNCWLWLKTMQQVNFNIATVWNSNSYYSEETAELLAGFIDLYLLDFKYGNNKCSEAISDAPHYWETATRNHLIAQKFGELIIRVLVLPGHNHCCTRPILEWISNNLGPLTRVNLMFQYRPEYKAYEIEELKRRLTKSEIQEAIEISKEMGLKNLVKS